MRSGVLLFLLPLVLMAACSDIDVSKARSTTGRAPSVAEVPDADETVRGPDDPPIVTLDIGSRLKERPLTRSETLPGGIIVPNTNLKAVPVTAALQAVLDGTDVSLSWDSSNFESRLVTVTNLSGSLPVVVRKICTSAKVFCSYRNGLLELKERETFVIDLPSIPTKSGAAGATNTMADTISLLSGDQAKIDNQGGNLLYTTDVEGYEHVHEYLDQLRHGRPLIVMQLYIWEVTLNNDHATGINWKSFSLDEFGGPMEKLAISGLTGFTSLTSPGVSLGAKLTGRVDADTVLQFLATQGQVQTVSNPQLTFVSGSNAEFRVGGKQRYIAQVGQLTSSVSGTSSSGVGTNTVSTESIDTGLTITTSGLYEGGVISALLELTTQDVVSLNPTTMESGVTVDLPETSERKVSTSIRVRPGDNLVLAGLVTSRDVNDRDGIPLPFGARVPTFSRDQLKNTELVVLVKPSVVVFAEKKIDPETEKLKERMNDALSEQTAVVIDKDGAKMMQLPADQGLQTPTVPAPYRAELMVPYDGRAQPVQPMPLTPSENGTAIDGRMMQGGFGQAFRELSEPDDGQVVKQ
ncbi:MAG: hypothetical protein EOM37_01545 [Proteobacteria bacterium]|nr:hypothetical protein [Pseudomonadota bacterium]